jgi:hypothetical protein
MDDFKRLGCASVQLYPFSPEARKIWMSASPIKKRDLQIEGRSW